MAQQAAGAPVTVREAIQVRDARERAMKASVATMDRFVARDLDWIDCARDDASNGWTRRRDARDSMGWRLTGRVV